MAFIGLPWPTNKAGIRSGMGLFSYSQHDIFRLSDDVYPFLQRNPFVSLPMNSLKEFINLSIGFWQKINRKYFIFKM
jgi:hypothetical protein